MEQLPAEMNPAAAEAAPLPSLGDLMTVATKVVINSPGIFLGIWAATGLPSFLLSLAVGYQIGLTDKAAIDALIQQRRFDLVGVMAMVAVIGLILSQFGTTATILAASDAALGRDPSLGDALERALSRFPAVLWTEVVVAARVLLGFLLLIIPGIVMAIRYGFAQMVATLDQESGAAAARRSRDIIVPHMGKVIGNATALVLLVAAVAFALGTAGGMIQGIVALVVGKAAGFAVQALVQGVISLASAWNIAALTALYSALSARTPRSS